MNKNTAITQKQIEDKVFEYWTTHSRAPRFVLLNRSAYDKFSQSQGPKERIVDSVIAGVTVCEHMARIYQIHLATGPVRILSTDAVDELFEVVG